MAQGRQRAPRRDAAANRERLIRAALDLLAIRDADISFKELAAHAEVGVGTVYRHFPTADDLIRALYDRMVEVLEARLATVPQHERAWDTLNELVTAFTMAIADTPGLRAVQRRMYRIDPAYAPARSLAAGLDALVARAVADGDLRAGVSSGDLVLAALSLGSFVNRPTRKERVLLRRQLGFLLDGMRARGGLSELPETDMTRDEFHQFVHRPASRAGR